MTPYRVTAPHFCAAFVVRGGVVVKVAPILKWCKGWGESKTLAYMRHKGWEVERV